MGSTQRFVLHRRRRQAEGPKWVPVGSSNFRSSWVRPMWGQDWVKVKAKVSEGELHLKRRGLTERARELGANFTLLSVPR